MVLHHLISLYHVIAGSTTFVTNCEMTMQVTFSYLWLFLLQIVFEGSKRYRDETGRDLLFNHGKENRIVPMEERTHYIDGLMPKTIYTFNISAKFMDGNWGPDYTMRVETSVDG